MNGDAPRGEAKAKTEAHALSLLEAAADGIVGIDERGCIRMANAAAHRLFGYAAGELVGREASLLLPPSHPDFPLAGGGVATVREVTGLRKDGSTFPLEFSIAEAREGGERVFAGVLRDITERKQAERFRQTVESAPNSLVMVDAKGGIVLFNAQAEESFGYRREEVLGQPVELIVPERYRAAHPALRAAFLASPRPRPMGAGRDLHGRRKDGSEFPIEIGLSPIETPEGLFVLAAIVDITERKRAEQSLREGKEQLERAVAALQAKNEEVRAVSQQLWQAAKLASVGELAASIAHELNNPLATVSLRVESVLGRTPLDDPRRRPLEIVQQETQRMASLVANLLQFSRQGVEQISTVDVHQELAGALDLVHHHLRKRRAAVVREFAPGIPTVYADRQKLRQVFLNLLTNAGDAMPEGGTLTIRTAIAPPGGKAAVRIDFADTGVGIPAEHIGKVMDPFFTTKEEGRGTGLGLAICRRIVEEHRGTIQIRSEAGKGTTVSLVLPVRNGANVSRLQGEAK